jgi:integrase/recombinase XerD
MADKLGSTSVINDFLSYSSVEKGLAKNTIAAYRLDLRKFQEYLELTDRNFGDVSSVFMDEFLGWLRGAGNEHEPGSESSNSRIVVTVRNLFKFIAISNRTVNPLQDYSPPAIPARLPKALSVNEVLLLIESAKFGDDKLALRNCALIEILYATGARISEVTSLKVKDVSQMQETLAIKLLGKGSKERVVPIGNFARISIEQYLLRSRATLLGGRGSDGLLLNSRGNNLSRQSAWAIVAEAAERAEISTHVTPHSLRHSFATHLLDGGADIRVVQELLGHSSVTTTQIYTLVTIDKLRESYASSHPRAK